MIIVRGGYKREEWEQQEDNSKRMTPSKVNAYKKHSLIWNMTSLHHHKLTYVIYQLGTKRKKKGKREGEREREKEGKKEIKVQRKKERKKKRKPAGRPCPHLQRKTYQIKSMKEDKQHLPYTGGTRQGGQTDEAVEEAGNKQRRQFSCWYTL